MVAHYDLPPPQYEYYYDASSYPRYNEPYYRRPYTYAERAELCSQNGGNLVAKALFEIMARKHTNLVLSADVDDKDQIIELFNAIGPYICAIKLHCDIINGWDEGFARTLQELAKIHDVIIFEDRKFADIGNTVQLQYTNGYFKIANWADLVNAHLLPGEGIVKGLREAGQSVAKSLMQKRQILEEALHIEGKEEDEIAMELGRPKGKALLLVAQMSSEGNLLDEDYALASIEVARKYPDFVIGFICQENLMPYQQGLSYEELDFRSKFLFMTPGVNLDQKGDALGQQYNHPHYVIGIKGSDIQIVGRGIIKAKNPAEAARKYRLDGMVGYERSLQAFRDSQFLDQ
jgi:orotidine-5'-phosphate decarboxylase